MRERTICHVFDLGATTGGSFIPLIGSLARAVTARGDRFVAFATDVPGATWPDELRASGADLHLVHRDAEVIAGLRALQPSIVHTHFTRYDLPVLRGAPRARIFWHVHSHREILSPLARIKAFVKYRLLSRRVEAVVTVSGAMRDECIEWYAPPERVRVVYNAVDPERFRPAQPEERAAARFDFGISPSDRVILFFERRPYKGGAVLRRALALLPDHRLLVLGGAKADRDLFGEAPRVIAIERVADSRRAYWAVDTLAFPSENEAFGAVVIEALACGVPVAASDIPAVHEICDGLESAFIFPAGDGSALAAALRSASSCADATSGRERVKERFSLDRWTRDILALYQ